MISFRYHLVTIVAVFLALAIGLLGGGAFVQPALQEELQDQTERLQRANDDLRAEVDELRSQIGRQEAFMDAAVPYLMGNRLAGTEVVVVTQPEVEDEVLSTAQAALLSAGARIVATVSATEQLVSQDPTTQRELAAILGSPSAVPEDLPSLTAQRLAERLDGGGAPPLGDDVLEELLSAGFLAPAGTGPTAATLEDVGVPGQVVVVLSGGRGEEPTLAPEAFAVPLVAALAGLEVPVAAGESLLSDYPFVELVRGAGNDGTVTVDDLDETMGGAALVLGLDELLATGVGGAYGMKDGAEPLPAFP